MRYLTLLMMILVACQSNRNVIPERAVASTAIVDLPASSMRQFQHQLPTPVSEAMIAEADADYLLLTNIYERISPAVLAIEVVAQVPGQTETIDIERGSGFIYDLNGHVVTNAHVVLDAEEITVAFDDGYVTTAEVVGLDVFSDLAVIKIDAPTDRLIPLVITNSDQVKVGERAIAIGNPFGLNSSMTVGIVSALGRQLSSAEMIDDDVLPGFDNPRIIQVDTSINPGNSGGPLLNSRGEVIGVTAAIRSDSGIFEGVGFAIPSNTIHRVVPDLIATGEVEYSYIGINTVPPDLGLSVAALAEELELPVTAGVMITNVMPDSPADTAGLQGGNDQRFMRGVAVCVGGDIIVAVNGKFVQNMDDLVAYLLVNTRPGDTVELMVVRGGETFELPVTLSDRPSSAEIPTCGD